MTIASLAVLALSVSAAFATAEKEARSDAKAPPIPKLEPAITRAEIEAHVRWLASDELAGRATGTPECDRAAAYLVEVLRAQGAEPAGDAGTFLQAVPLERTSLASVPALTLVDADGTRTELVYGPDFDAPWVAVDGRPLRLVVARKAEEIPAQAERDVALFVDGTTSERRRWLADARHGAGEGFGAVLSPGTQQPGRPRDRLSRVGALRRSEKEARRPEGTVRINHDALDRVRSGQVRTIELTVQAVLERVSTSNVVARIPGRAPRDGKERAVVISAHYDHIAHGHGPTEGEDKIFNGADDDASGVAAVLEIAGALGKGGKLAHDVIVLLATAEEVGLLGTEQYLDHPAVPLDRTIANINCEMVGRPDAKVGGKGALWLTGDALTNLGRALRDLEFRVLPDPRPEQHFFERSDNYAFVRRGVIGQTFSTYDMHGDYHMPSDEADKIDFDHLTQCTATIEKAVRVVADGEVALSWTSGKPPVAR